MDAQSRSKGFGIVVMGSIAEAENAIQMFNDYDLDGRIIAVKIQDKSEKLEVYQAPEVTSETTEPTPSTHLFVGNLAFAVQWSQLKEVFSQCGHVVRSDIVLDHQGRSRGFGMIIMSNVEEAHAAIAQINGLDLMGRNIDVRFDRFSKEKIGGKRANHGFQNKKTYATDSPTVFVGNLPFTVFIFNLDSMARR